MRNHIRHNYPSLIHCLRAFHILFFAYLLFRCYCYNYYRNLKRFIFTFATATFIIIPLLLLNTLMQILSYPGVVELTTQLLILKNILWLPLCRINKFGLNTLPSKAVATPYTCGLSRLISGAVAGEHRSILWVTWDLYLLITTKNLKDDRTKILPSTTRRGKELPSSSALDSPSVISKLATPKPATSMNSDMSHVIDDATSAMHDT